MKINIRTNDTVLTASLLGSKAYWSPGPDVAIFYRDDGQRIPNPGIVVLGRVEGSVEALDRLGSMAVTFELADHSEGRR